jgi:serine/threonine-protein kinase
MALACPQCRKPYAMGMPACAFCSSPLPTTRIPTEEEAALLPRLPERFRILRLLGRGGMGRVYLCEDQDLEVEVAVKVLPEEIVADEKTVDLIRNEARLAAKLRGCPGILQLYEFERHEGASFLVMEYAPGGSLHHRIVEKGRLPEEECRALGAGIAEALGFAHEKKVLHRDVKPGNVLLSSEGDVRVGDFGLAKVMAESSSRATAGGIVGTPYYLPPEVIARKKVDHRGDLYALGVVLYEMATGEPPFLGTFAEVALAKSRSEGKVPDPRELRPELSEDYAAVVRRLLAWDPLDRYGDGKQIAAILRGEQKRPDAPSRRESLASALPVEPAVRGLPAPGHPALEGVALPAGIALHGGRIFSLKDGAELAFIPAGPFTMGSDRGSPDEAPAHEVRLGPYLIDRHEVTIWQFARFCTGTKRAMPEQPKDSNDRHPVVNVTWSEARDYAAWAGRLLPTEAQWEKAARGTDGRQYPWGNEAPDPDLAQVRNPAVEGTATVGAYPSGRSPYGVLDMLGNAWEWCGDWYAADYFAGSPARDPVGPGEGSSRVLRGGVWDDRETGLRVTRRRRSRPDSRYDFVGFRCVLELKVSK